MQTREIYGLIGAIFGMTGLFLFILWIGDFVPFVRFSVAVLLLGAGVWAVGVAAGLRWGEVFAPLRQSLGQALAGLTPAPSAAAASPWRCPSCGRPVEAGWRFCLRCGQPLEWKTCPRCGQTQLAVGEFCASCGAPLKEETPPAS
jgi:membrane protease subunit (stomatin/prohibitin family)